MGHKKANEIALTLFRQHGGILRTKQALELGIHPRTLYALRDDGEIVQMVRGWYRLADLPPISDPDLVAVSSAVPKGVICLISALSFHGITTQVPHYVDLAIEQKAKRPQITYPPIRIFWFSGPAFTEGIETHLLDEVPVRIFNPAKSVADCFKFRNKIGLDVALEAMEMNLRQRLSTVDDIMGFARICRVEKIMRPYLEATLYMTERR